MGVIRKFGADGFLIKGGIRELIGGRGNLKCYRGGRFIYRGLAHLAIVNSRFIFSRLGI